MGDQKAPQSCHSAETVANDSPMLPKGSRRQGGEDRRLQALLLRRLISRDFFAPAISAVLIKCPTAQAGHFLCCTRRLRKVPLVFAEGVFLSRTPSASILPHRYLWCISCAEGVAPKRRPSANAPHTFRKTGDNPSSFVQGVILCATP